MKLRTIPYTIPTYTQQHVVHREGRNLGGGVACVTQLLFIIFFNTHIVPRVDTLRQRRLTI